MGKTKTAFVGETLEEKNKATGPDGLRPGGKRFKKAHQKDDDKVHISGLKGGQRVKVVEAAPTEEAPIIEEGKEEKTASAKATASQRKIVEKIRSKKYQEAKAKVEAGKSYSPKDAIKLLKEISYSSFDGTVELHLILKKAGGSVQVTLPHTAGREKKIEIASDETVEKLKNGKIDFDILITTPAMMPKLVPFAKLLGPKGLMPNPKNGTLVPDPKKAKGFSGNTKTLKAEKDAPLIHTVIGKVSQNEKELEENLEAIFKALGGAKQIVRAFIKSTMSPSIKIQL